MTEAAIISETSVTFYQAKRPNIEDGNNLHERRRKKIKFHTSPSSHNILKVELI